MKLHKDITDSGLANKFEMSCVTTNEKLSKFLGQKVRFKKSLLTKDFVQSNGTLCKTEIYKVLMVQKDWKGEDCLRGFCTSYNDNFGRVLSPNEIEIIEENK
jgi:hypothetical protein